MALCACPGVTLKGLTLRKFVSDVFVCMSVLFYVCVGTGFMDWLEKMFIYIYIYEKSLAMCISAYDRVWLSWGDPVQLTGCSNPVTN